MKYVLLFDWIANFYKTEINLTMFSSSFGIVGTEVSFVMQIKIPFHPLHEFKVVLVFRFGKFLNVDVFENFTFGKSQLKNFEIVDELPLIDCVETDSLELNFAGMHDIKDLTINGASAKLFDFGDIDFE